MNETITWYGVMPPHGDPTSHDRFPVTICATQESPKWVATIIFSSPDLAFSGHIPDALQVGATVEEEYSTINSLYRALVDLYGLNPSLT